MLRIWKLLCAAVPRIVPQGMQQTEWRLKKIKMLWFYTISNWNENYTPKTSPERNIHTMRTKGSYCCKQLIRAVSTTAFMTQHKRARSWCSANQDSFCPPLEGFSGHLQMSGAKMRHTELSFRRIWNPQSQVMGFNEASRFFNLEKK